MFTKNVTKTQNTPNRTSDKKSGEYAPIPLKIVRSKKHYPLFLFKKRLFLQYFLTKF